MKLSPIRPTIDLDAPGIRHGHLRLPWSRDESAWGNLMIPITVARRGDGPTALLTGASHGDEYEGPVALVDLARRLQPDDIAGRVIIVPFMNYPAFLASRRLSPVDGGNMNRVFPGRPDGTLTEKIADFFQRTLLPQADLVLDLHSGGRTLDFLPLAASHVLPNPDQEARCAAARDAFAAPYSLSMREIDAAGMYDSAAEVIGKTFVTTELGGGGTLTAGTLAIACRGIANVLKHASILVGDPEPASSTQLAMPSDDCFTFSDRAGLIEPCLDLGNPVREGDVLCRIHPIERLGEPPAEYRARLDGILMARHFPGMTQTGDCLAVVATVAG